ncbi:MAG: hypothetical protein CMI90_05110 [Pelagibacteraceae bacterium]|nr:hypothetical protein [Pelagibacteraceae bacterium]|tara:strand:+ start:5243 stop:5632 length:390 start_codon:yes stop_codon:yes gene_type:complete
MSIFGSSDKKENLSEDNYVFPSEKPSTSRNTFISEDLEIQGEVFGKDYVELAGKIIGKAKSKKIDIRQSGSILGEVTADIVTVEGNVEGEIIAQDLYVKSTSKIKGTIKYKNIDIQNGAIITAELIKTI